MKWIVTTVVAAGSVLAAAHVEARKAGPARPEPNRIDIAYVEPKSAGNQPVYKLLKEHQVLEKVRELLSPLRLPHRLLLQVRDCDGISNAWSNEDSVTVCYEYVNDIWKNAPGTDDADGNCSDRYGDRTVAGRIPARSRSFDLRKSENSPLRPGGRRRRPVFDLHDAEIRQGRSTPADPWQRLPVQGRPGVPDADDRAAEVCGRARHARATLLQPAVHGLRQRPEAVCRRRRERISARGSRRGLQARICSGLACVRHADRTPCRYRSSPAGCTSAGCLRSRPSRSHGKGGPN